MRSLLISIVGLSLVACSGSGDGDEYADSEDAGSFHGYACTDDCSGHEAGYQWASDNDITDPDNCGGNSQSFIEGCQAYAEETGF